MPVPIDQAGPPGDSDAPHPPGGPQTSDRSRYPAAAPQFPLGPAERQAARRADQDKIDRIYPGHFAGGAADSASAAWAEAAPLLRAAWGEHEERYPERERATPEDYPDGSWSSGDHRKLTPGQNTEASKACTEIQGEGERVIFPALQRIEAADPDRRLAGLEHMIKGADRLKEKIADVLLVESHLTSRQVLDKVPDAVRYTFCYPSDHYADGVRADIDRLKTDGFEEIRLKNLWSSDQYRGINSQWRRPETGLRFEVQFHTPESLGAKELTHRAYERLRRPETETTKGERDELEEFQHRVNALLAAPPGAERIRNFPEGKR